MRFQQRALTAEVLVRVVSTFEIIESYPEDKYLPSFLVRGEHEGSVVTIYVPDPDEWHEGFRVRRATG